MRKFLSIVLVAAIFVSMVACGNNVSDPTPKMDDSVSVAPTIEPAIDLSGQWEQVDSDDEGSHYSAIISGDTIEVYWIDDKTEIRLLYWTGTFEEPKTMNEPYSWTSRNNTKKADLSLLASRNKTKEFSYENDQLSLNAESNDAIHMEKVRWAPDLNAGEFYEVDRFSFSVAGFEFFVPSYFEQDMDVPNGGTTLFRVKSESYNRGAGLSFFEWEFPLSQQEYEKEKDGFIKSFCGEDAQVLASREMVLAGLPAQFFVYNRTNQYDVTVHSYAVMLNNPAAQKILIACLGIASDNDYTSYFEDFVYSAKLIGEAAPIDTLAPTPTVGIRPEFKAAMDSYEEFFDEYVEFMKKFNNSDDMTSMLAEYSEYLTQYAETMEALSAIDDGSLSPEEAAYYLEVSTRINQKLLEVVQ